MTEGVKLGGVIIKRVTGFNGAYIKDNKIGPGAILKISRSGDVIPHILEVIKPAKQPQMPDMPYKWTESGVDIYIENANENEDVIKKQITEFFNVIGVDNLSYGIISNLCENGYDTPFKILKMKENDMSVLPGLGKVIAKKLYINIHKSLNVTLATLMKASSCFGRTLGFTRLDQICDEIPDVLELNHKQLKHKITQLNGFSDKISDFFVEGLDDFRIFLKKSLAAGITIKQEIKSIPISDEFKGMVVVFTGIRDKEVESEIINKGGSVGNGISSKTTILVVKDKNSSSSKTMKAKELNIKIMTLEEFKNKYKER